MAKLNTLDLDKMSFLKLERILGKVKQCPNVSDIEWRYSASRAGFHVRFYCGTDCDRCRVVFDHDMRWVYDYTYRNRRHTNVLWRVKNYLGKGRLEAGEWQNTV